MEREFLEKQGLNADQVKAVMAQYGKDVSELKSKASKADNFETQIGDLKDQLKDRDK